MVWTALLNELGCGARSVDQASQSDGQLKAKSNEQTRSGEPADAGGQSATLPSPSTLPTGYISPSEECELPWPNSAFNFIVNNFVNHTNAPLYLASENDTCGVWPAYVAFERDGEHVDIDHADCGYDCLQITNSGYQTRGEISPSCVPNPPCDAPLRIIRPGATISESVFPQYQTVHDLPGGCLPDGEPTTCRATHTLPAGTYTLIAHAYPELRCGDADCGCNPNPGDVCVGESGREPPRGAGEVQRIEVTLEFNPDSTSWYAEYNFY